MEKLESYLSKKYKEIKLRGRKTVQVIESVCKGCELCEATCPMDAISFNGFTDEMILEEFKLFL
ncbi:MAG: 4Fe-4S binding protein [Actinobacteria bacterium]|nr:4Fe-4S binding protein [Actinomycetota bacterium]